MMLNTVSSKLVDSDIFILNSLAGFYLFLKHLCKAQLALNSRFQVLELEVICVVPSSEPDKMLTGIRKESKDAGG